MGESEARSAQPMTAQQLLRDARRKLSRLNPELSRRDRRVIVLCDEGYQSSLAAATLRSFGLDATDVAGGAQEWIRCGLPLEAVERA